MDFKTNIELQYKHEYIFPTKQINAHKYKNNVKRLFHILQ